MVLVVRSRQGEGLGTYNEMLHDIRGRSNITNIVTGVSHVLFRFAIPFVIPDFIALLLPSLYFYFFIYCEPQGGCASCASQR